MQYNIQCNCPSSSDIENININCPKVWELFKDANLTGIFQLENPFTKKLCKALQPSCIEDLAALVNIIRPGILEALDENGKSFTWKYIDRKRGNEEITQSIKALEPILRDTCQLILYQEQAIKIANEIAGFTLEEADSLRKSIGTKDVKLMAKVKEEFIKGCLKVGKVSKEEAQQIADIIEKSQRYSMNLSHSTGYAIISYWTAYCKAHFPLEFYCSYLNHAKDRPKPHEEIKKLIYDAYKNDIDVMPPLLEKLNSEFLIEDNVIYYGLSSIKDIGESCIKDLKDVNNKTPLQKMSWCELLFNVLLNLKKNCARSFIACGALRKLSALNREKMFYEFDQTLTLTNKEINWIRNSSLIKNENSLQNLLKNIARLGSGKGKPLANKNRIAALDGIIQSLNKPSYSTKDNITKLIDYEKATLGLPMIVGPSDNLVLNNSVTCMELSKKQVNGGNFHLAARVDSFKEYINDKGKIGYLCLIDNTGELRGVKCYTKCWQKYGHYISINRDFIFEIYIKGDNIIINKIHPF